MKKTVFWSWQSDFGARENRGIIRESLVAAIKELSEQLAIEERIEIDHDTKGLPGSPDIVSAILSKIDEASVFVADITPIAKSCSGKHLANPNVLIELGYAKKSLGTDRLITIWNTTLFDSQPENLPFDLRGRRAPITYKLPKKSSKEEYRKARTELTKQIKSRLEPCVASIPALVVVKPNWHPKIQSDPSIWVEPNTTFTVNEGWGSGEKYFEPGSRWYVRVLPSSFDQKVLETGVHAPFMDNYGGFSWGHTAEGLMTYSGSVRADVSNALDAGSMWFEETGEIWMLQNGIAGEYQGRNQFYGDYVAQKWIEFVARGLNKLDAHGGKNPYHVRVGVTGLKGTTWPVSHPTFGEPPAALKDRLEIEFQAPNREINLWFDHCIHAWIKLRKIFSVPPPEESEIQEQKGALANF